MDSIKYFRVPLWLSVALASISSVSSVNSQGLFDKGGALSIDKPFSKGGGLSIDKPLDKGGALSIDKPLDKGGGLSIDKPLDKGGALSIDKPFDKGGALSIDKPFNGDIGKFVKEHPWETVAAVALIAGGAYLIVYEGYSLQVAVGTKTITLVSGGIATGGSSVAAGSGVIAYAALQPQGGQRETVIAPNSAKSVNQASEPQSSHGEKVAGPRPVVELPSPLPQLDKNASDNQKFEHALRVLSWSDRYEPPSLFDVKQYSGSLSPAEIALLEAITAVQSVPEAASESAATEQTKKRMEKLVATAVKTVTTGAPQWSVLLKAAHPIRSATEHLPPKQY